MSPISKERPHETGFIFESKKQNYRKRQKYIHTNFFMVCNFFRLRFENIKHKMNLKNKVNSNGSKLTDIGLFKFSPA